MDFYSSVQLDFTINRFLKDAFNAVYIYSIIICCKRQIPFMHFPQKDLSIYRGIPCRGRMPGRGGVCHVKVTIDIGRS